jgi:hypothetical protein
MPGCIGIGTQRVRASLYEVIGISYCQLCYHYIKRMDGKWDKMYGCTRCSMTKGQRTAVRGRKKSQNLLATSVLHHRESCEAQNRIQKQGQYSCDTV